MTQNQNKKVAIYTTPTCVYCRMAKEFFSRHQIAFEEYNVLPDLQRREEMVAKSGQMGVPVITVTGDGREEVVVGFDERRLRQLLAV